MVLEPPRASGRLALIRVGQRATFPFMIRLFLVNSQLKALLQVVALVLVAIGALVLAISRAGALWPTGEQRAGVWFYDLSEKQLYPAPINTIPPHQGIGGKRGDGVRAMVVAFGAGAKKSGERRIAYLETFRPELKDLLDRMQAARAAAKPFAGTPPARDSDLYQTNTLVRRLDDADWHPLDSPEAAKITAEWRAWRGAGGEKPVICVP